MPLCAVRPLLKSDVETRMAKADLCDVRKAENVAGRIVERTQQIVGLSLKQFADLVRRDDRQIARWKEGLEHPQLDALVDSKRVRRALLLALAEHDDDGDVELETVIRVRRRA